MSTILVTGGDGALGSVLVAQLRSSGYDVVRGTRRLPQAITDCSMDVTDFAQTSKLIHSIKPSTIIHLAATFSTDYDTAFATNVLGSKNLISAVQATGLPIRIVLAGSAAEYGLVSPDENPIREDRVLRPVSVYGLTKSWQTNYGLMCAHQGCDIVIARIFNLDGPNLSERLFVGRIHQQIQEVLSGYRKRIEVGVLSATRDYISVKDAVSQLINITLQGQAGQIYHVASGRPTQMRALLEQHLTLNGLDFSIVDEAEALSGRSGYDVPIIYADIRRTTALLNE